MIDPILYTDIELGITDPALPPGIEPAVRSFTIANLAPLDPPVFRKDDKAQPGNALAYRRDLVRYR